MNLIRIHRHELFQREDTYPLRGIAMLMIIIHHIWINMCRLDIDPTPFLTAHVFKPAGQFGTGLFFLISGYGMFYSLIRHKNLSLCYLLSRVNKLIKPYIFCFMLFVCAIIAFRKDMFNASLIVDFFTLTIPGSSTWFLKVIIGIYIVSFFIFRLNANVRIKVIIVTSLCLVYFVVASITLPLFWWSSILCYPLGMLIALHLKYYKRGGGGFLIPLMAVLMVIMHKLGLSYYVPETMLFSLISIEAVRFINIDNGLLKFIGTESFSFYLFQSLFLFVGLEIGLSGNWYLYACFVLTSTFFLSLIYSRIKRYQKI